LIRTTPEHEGAAKVLRGSVIEKIEKRGAVRLGADRLVRFAVFEPRPKFRYQDVLVDGVWVKREVPIPANLAWS